MTITYKKVKDPASGEELPSINKIIDDKFNLAIPNDPDNRDYKEYLAWVAAGNTAEAAD